MSNAGTSRGGIATRNDDVARTTGRAAEGERSAMSSKLTPAHTTQDETKQEDGASKGTQRRAQTKHGTRN
jgi:hypothetical protein